MTRSTSKKIRTALAFVGASFLLGATALAGGLSDFSGLTATGGAAGLGSSDTNIATIVGRFIGALISLLGMVFVVLLVYGGFIWMTAQGSEEKIKKAKGIITSAVIGLVVVFASYTIATAVIGALSSATAPAAAPAEPPPPGP